MMSRFAILPAILPALVASSAASRNSNNDEQDPHALMDPHLGDTVKDGVPKLTPGNWKKETAGKSIFVRFNFPSCQKTTSNWNRLARKFDHILDVDCTDDGNKKICSEHTKRKRCSFKYGVGPSDLDEYTGRLSFKALSVVAEQSFDDQRERLQNMPHDAFEAECKLVDDDITKIHAKAFQLAGLYQREQEELKVEFEAESDECDAELAKAQVKRSQVKWVQNKFVDMTAADKQREKKELDDETKPPGRKLHEGL